MGWSRRAWFVLAALAVVGTVGILLGMLFGSAGLSVDGVTADGETPTNETANCDQVVVRSVVVAVDLSRATFGPANPQWWQVGVNVRASVFGGTNQRQVAIGPGSSATVTIPFTRVRDRRRAPRERVDAVVQVLRGTTELARETATATLGPVAAGRDC